MLKLREGQRLLDVGCGWGGMLRYSARRGVRATGITLSSDQRDYVNALIAEERLPAEVRYQDFFTYEPEEKFHAVSLMGVLEDLSDYRHVMRSLTRWLAPGGRAYFDFAADRDPWSTHSFVTEHIWPGTFRMVYLPEFVAAVRESPLELIQIDNDRMNYRLWAEKMLSRWQAARATIERDHGRPIYRCFELLYAGIAAMMNRPSHSCTAYRVVVELPSDSDLRFRTSRWTTVQDRARTMTARARNLVLGPSDRAAAE
jgi:cyclopropane-fatty-acyl-phospholipid synthase